MDWEFAKPEGLLTDDTTSSLRIRNTGKPSWGKGASKLPDLADNGEGRGKGLGSAQES